MKQGTLLNKIVMLVLLAAIVVYLIASAWNSLHEPFSTVVSYAYSVDDSLEVTGFLVREETVIPGQSGIVDLLPQEGEKVSRGGTVALLYQNSSALDRKQELYALELEREQLQYSLTQEDAGRDASALNQAVIDSMVALKASAAAGDLTGLEGETLNLKSLVYRRDYTYGSGGESGSIEDAIQDVESRISALTSQASQDTTRVTTDRAGVFSGQVDGYETLLTPDQLETYTPSALDALARQKPAGDESAIGKLITDATWYFVCPISEEDAGRLYEGGSVTVRFSRDWSGEVDMQVERIGTPEDGRVAVVLSPDRYLSQVTLLRRQTVELVFDTLTGIRVPKQALRVDTRTVTDAETGEERQEQINVVYALVGTQAEKKPVVIVDQEEDFCLVQPAPAATQTEQKKILRAGDEIIVAAEELYDGKFVR